MKKSKDTPRELIEFYDGAPDQTLIPTGNAKDRRANAKDRRVKQVPTIGLLRRIGEMDRRAHSTQPEPTSPADTTELLSKYRAALIHAYELGKEVKIDVWHRSSQGSAHWGRQRTYHVISGGELMTTHLALAVLFFIFACLVVVVSLLGRLR
jgi:hypothetical protein